MWHLPSALTASSAVSGANTTTGGPLNLGSTESHQITSNSVSPPTTENTINNQQSSVIKDEFNNSSYQPTGADYSLQNLDSYYKTNSSSSSSAVTASVAAESSSVSVTSSTQQENQQPTDFKVKSDTDYSGSVPTSSSAEHVSSHYDYPAYYSTV